MPKDELGYEYLRRSDGGAFIITAWVCAVGAVICGAAGAFISSLDVIFLGSALGSLWAVFFVTGYVTRAIYFVAGDAEKARSRAEKSARWRAEEGYKRVEI